jgi:hypothetical protein
MRNLVEIENIEEMRIQQGIEDIELREEIRGLVTGDLVRLTFLTGGNAWGGEMLLVRITQIKGGTFRGKLVTGPASVALSNLRVGMPVRFTTAHIHSIPQKESRHERRCSGG